MVRAAARTVSAGLGSAPRTPFLVAGPAADAAVDTAADTAVDGKAGEFA